MREIIDLYFHLTHPDPHTKRHVCPNYLNIASSPLRPGIKFLSQEINKCASNLFEMYFYLAFFRHTAGYCWAYNTRNFFQFYYPKFDIGLWTFCASVFGGSFGVFAGGFFSDRFLPLTIPHPYLIIIPLSDL